MFGENGNGNPKPVDIDVTDEHAFRTGVVQYLQLISDRTNDLPALRKTVNKHETIVNVGRITGIPILIALQEGAKHLMARLGW
jgi:hypothetical protein